MLHPKEVLFDQPLTPMRPFLRFFFKMSQCASLTSTPCTSKTLDLGSDLESAKYHKCTETEIRYSL